MYWTHHYYAWAHFPKFLSSLNILSSPLDIFSLLGIQKHSCHRPCYHPGKYFFRKWLLKNVHIVSPRSSKIGVISIKKEISVSFLTSFILHLTSQCNDQFVVCFAIIIILQLTLPFSFFGVVPRWIHWTHHPTQWLTNHHRQRWQSVCLFMSSTTSSSSSLFRATMQHKGRVWLWMTDNVQLWGCKKEMTTVLCTHHHHYIFTWWKQKRCIPLCKTPSVNKWIIF